MYSGCVQLRRAQNSRRAHTLSLHIGSMLIVQKHKETENLSCLASVPCVSCLVSCRPCLALSNLGKTGPAMVVGRFFDCVKYLYNAWK